MRVLSTHVLEQQHDRIMKIQAGVRSVLCNTGKLDIEFANIALNRQLEAVHAELELVRENLQTVLGMEKLTV